MKINVFDTDKSFEYENGFYLTSDISRLGKEITHYELYKKIVNLPGDVIELGVFKGTSLIRFATYRELLENVNSRKIIGFDTFDEFPQTNFEDDIELRQNFIDIAGVGLNIDELKSSFEYKGIKNVDLIKGDIVKMLPNYVSQNPQLKISLLHIDTDIYEPAKVALESLYDKVISGGIIIFDNYASFPGETKAVDDFFKSRGESIEFRKFPFSHDIPTYIIKPF